MIDVGGVALLGGGGPQLRRRRGRRQPGATTRGSSASCGSSGIVSAELRQQLAAEAFGIVAAYHAEIAAYLNQVSGDDLPEPAGAGAREGRGPALRREPPPAGGLLPRDDPPQRRRSPTRRQLQGGRPRFNNLLDLDAAYRIARDFTAPTVAIVKHTDPVGLASNDELVEAYRKALESRLRWPPSAASSASTASSTARPPGRSRRTPTRRSSRRASATPRWASSGPKPALEILAVPPDPTEGLRDYGIANLDFKRVAGGLLVETQDAPRPRTGPAPGRHQAPADARGADRPALRLACRPPRPLERDRAGQERGDGRHRRRPGQPPGLGGDRPPPGRRPGPAGRHGLRRLLPVPGRDPARGRAPASPRSSSRAARSATRWPSRSPTATTWRWSSPAAVTSATEPPFRSAGPGRSHGTAPRPRDGPGHRGRGHRLGPLHGPRRPARGRPGRDRGDAPDDGRDRHGRHDRHRRGRARRGADALHRRAGGPTRGRRGPDDPGDRHRGRSARGHEPRRPRAGRTRSPSSPRRRRAASSTRPTPTSRSCASGRSRPATSTSA